MKRFNLTYTKVALILITAILCFAIFSVILYQLSAPSSPNFEQRLNTQLKVINTGVFDLNDNTITKNEDGTLTYRIYSYSPTDTDLEILSRFFNVPKDKIKLEKENDFDKSFYNDDPQVQLR